MADGHKLLAELTSVKKVNAQMCVRIDTAMWKMEVVRDTFRVGSMENERPLRTKEEFVARVTQLCESEDQLSFLRDELVRRDGEGATATVIRHVEELGSLRLELEQASTANAEVAQLREGAREHGARVRMAVSGVTSFLQDEVSRLSQQNHRICDKLTSAKAQVAMSTISRNYFRKLAQEQKEREGAKVRLLQAFDEGGDKNVGFRYPGGGKFSLQSGISTEKDDLQYLPH